MCKGLPQHASVSLPHRCSWCKQLPQIAGACNPCWPLTGLLSCCADTFHKPGLKMQAKILHHLFTVVGTDVIKAPLWDVAAQGPTAYPNNLAFVQQQVSQLLTTSFPNMRPQQVEVRRSHCDCQQSGLRSRITSKRA